jgi:hypothetical protein
MPPSRPQRRNGLWLRRLGAALALAVCLAPNLPAAPGANTATAPELHTFTDPQGNLVPATVVSIVGDAVNLQRADGHSWSEPLSYFSAADQAYILESQIQVRVARGHPVFTITAFPVNADETTVNINNGVRVSWKAAYKINLKNETIMKLANLRVRCVVFKTPLVPDISGNYNLAVELHAQTLPVDEAGASATTNILTDQLDMQSFQARGAYFPTAPNAHAETDQLTAIWLRVYDGNNFLIQEWCSSSEIFKQGSWDDEWARGGGTSTGGARAGAGSGSSPARVR